MFLEIINLLLMLFLTSRVQTMASNQNGVAEFFYETPEPLASGYEFEMLDLLGLGDESVDMSKQFSSTNSASKFLLEVYDEINEEEEERQLERLHQNKGHRWKRALRDNGWITDLDRLEIEQCNNIITFAGKAPKQEQPTPANNGSHIKPLLVSFNTNAVPRELKLVHAALRLYQDPALGKYHMMAPQNLTVSIYRKIYNRKLQMGEYRLWTSLNATTSYAGWLEFNITRLLHNWLQFKTLQQAAYGNKILIEVYLKSSKIPPTDVGLVGVQGFQRSELQPFIIGYFNGPELLQKIQTLRFKRDVIQRKRRNRGGHYMSRELPPFPQVYKAPKCCERLNFTLDFKELHMHNWVIAPKKFEAFFCGGECNFPLGAKMNATNHAIVQTLMHLKQPNLPKASCVPTKLGAISILHYLNEDSVNLSKYPQSVAKECGCH